MTAAIALTLMVAGIVAVALECAVAGALLLGGRGVDGALCAVRPSDPSAYALEMGPFIAGPLIRAVSAGKIEIR